MIHFVGFSGPEYLGALRIWGKPDFFHRWLDVRAEQEFAPGDIVIVASGCKDRRARPSFNDSGVF